MSMGQHLATYLDCIGQSHPRSFIIGSSGFPDMVVDISGVGYISRIIPVVLVMVELCPHFSEFPLRVVSFIFLEFTQYIEFHI